MQTTLCAGSYQQRRQEQEELNKKARAILYQYLDSEMRCYALRPLWSVVKALRQPNLNQTPPQPVGGLIILYYTLLWHVLAGAGRLHQRPPPHHPVESALLAQHCRVHHSIRFSWGAQVASTFCSFNQRAPLEKEQRTPRCQHLPRSLQRGRLRVWIQTNEGIGGRPVTQFQQSPAFFMWQAHLSKEDESLPANKAPTEKTNVFQP